MTFQAKKFFSTSNPSRHLVKKLKFHVLTVVFTVFHSRPLTLHTEVKEHFSKLSHLIATIVLVVLSTEQLHI